MIAVQPELSHSLVATTPETARSLSCSVLELAGCLAEAVGAGFKGLGLLVHGAGLGDAYTVSILASVSPYCFPGSLHRKVCGWWWLRPAKATCASSDPRLFVYHLRFLDNPCLLPLAQRAVLAATP